MGAEHPSKRPEKPEPAEEPFTPAEVYYKHDCGHVGTTSGYCQGCGSRSGVFT